MVFYDLHRTFVFLFYTNLEVYTEFGTVSSVASGTKSLTPLKLLSTDYVLQSKICPQLSLKASWAENGFYLYFRREIVLYLYVQFLQFSNQIASNEKFRTIFRKNA